VITITDGEENNSTPSSAVAAARVKALLFETQATDRWTFAFQLPFGQRDKFAAQYGVPKDNILEWAATDKGVEVARQSLAASAQVTNSSMGQYFGARSMGMMSVKKFYDTTTDLSQVTATAVKTKLDDISDRFKSYEVPKELPIKDFVEEKTKKEYVVGSTYYQLMKVEKVQPNKQILIQEKGKKAVWGGRDARHLIGLKDGETARLRPGNHANYDIFVQSTSVNRKLPRGTKVLVDITQKTPLEPTWDHTAVAQKVGKE
jgi:hypothetical protein